MVFRFDIINFIAAICFIAFAIRAAYRRKHLAELEQRGAIKPEVATHIRNMRRPWFVVWLSGISGAYFLLTAFIRI